VHASYAGARLTLSLYAIHLHATPFTVGVLMSLLALLPAFYSVGAGRMIDRIGVRKPMLVAAGLVCAATALAAAVPRLEALFAVSVLASGFMLFHIGAHYAIGTSGDPGKRVHNFSMLALAFATSSFIGPMICGFMIDAFGHRWTFFAMALIAAVPLVILLRTSDPPRAPDQGRGKDKRQVGDLLRMPMLRRVFVTSALLTMTWDLFTFVLPIYGTRIGLSASSIGLVLASFGAATFFVRLLVPLVAKKLREWTMLLAAMGISACSFVIFPFVENTLLLGVLAFILGFGLGSAQPTVMALLYNLTPRGRSGEAIGIRSLLINISQTSIPLLFGALGTVLGMAPVFCTMALCLAGGAYYVRKPPPQSSPQGDK
jgi:predicted MFS family arabinose efflux permease